MGSLATVSSWNECRGVETTCPSPPPTRGSSAPLGWSVEHWTGRSPVWLLVDVAESSNKFYFYNLAESFIYLYICMWKDLLDIEIWDTCRGGRRWQWVSGESRAQPLSWSCEGLNPMDFSLRKCRFGVFLCPSTQFRVWQGVRRNSLIGSFLRLLLRMQCVLCERERLWGLASLLECSWKNRHFPLSPTRNVSTWLIPAESPLSDIWRGGIKDGFY